MTVIKSDINSPLVSTLLFRTKFSLVCDSTDKTMRHLVFLYDIVRRNLRRKIVIVY